MLRLLGLQGRKSRGGSLTRLCTATASVPRKMISQLQLLAHEVRPHVPSRDCIACGRCLEGASGSNTQLRPAFFKAYQYLSRMI